MALDEQHTGLSAEEATRLFANKAAAELADVDALAGSGAPGWSGAPLAPLAFVVARPVAGDGEADAVLSGPVGDAARKAAAALGVDADSYFAVASRPAEGIAPDVRDRRLALAIAAADPAVVIALDDDAACDLASALGTELPAGTVARVRGRVLAYGGSLGDSLIDPAAKAAVWATMKAAGAEGGLNATGRHKGAP